MMVVAIQQTYSMSQCHLYGLTVLSNIIHNIQYSIHTTITTFTTTVLMFF